MARMRLALALVAAAGVVLPGSASAHAAFVEATPQPGQRVEAAPGRVALAFTEPLNDQLTTVALTRVGDDRPVTARLLRVQNGRGIAATPAKPLGTGTYRAMWHTVSTLDGHALEGSFSFGVRAPAGGEQRVEASPLARGGWIRVLLRGLLYVFGLLFVAALLLGPLLGGPTRSWLVPATLGDAPPIARLRRRAAGLTEGLGWLAVIAAIGTAVAEAADAAGSLAPAGLESYLLSGSAGGARVAVAGLLVGAVLLCGRLPRLGGLLAVLALGAVAASGHASAATPRLQSVLFDWLHLVAGALWLGGIGLIAVVWARASSHLGPQGRLAVAREVLAPFGRVALPAFAVVSLTGVIGLVEQVGRLDAMWRSGYGQLLTVKIVIVLVIAVSSTVHALRLRPRLLAGAGERVDRRHWTLLRAEPVLGLGAVAVVAFLVAFPLPPRQLGEADRALAATPACDPCPLPRPAADELPVAGSAGSFLVAGWVRRTSTQVTGVVRVLDRAGRPARRPFAVTGGREHCGTGCRRFRLPPDRALRVMLGEAGRRFVTTLPTRWRPAGAARARRLVLRAQAVMRGLRSVREVEDVSSGPGSFARTTYRLSAPDRMAFTTDRGIRSVIVGRRRAFRAADGPWQTGDYSGALAFRTRTWFMWTTYARTVRLLGERREGGRRLAELALMDEATPVWIRLTVDLATGRAVDERMNARGHALTARYSGFDRPTTIRFPDAG